MSITCNTLGIPGAHDGDSTILVELPLVEVPEHRVAVVTIIVGVDELVVGLVTECGLSLVDSRVDICEGCEDRLSADGLFRSLVDSDSNVAVDVSVDGVRIGGSTCVRVVCENKTRSAGHPVDRWKAPHDVVVLSSDAGSIHQLGQVIWIQMANHLVVPCRIECRIEAVERPVSIIIECPGTAVGAVDTRVAPSRRRNADRVVAGDGAVGGNRICVRLTHCGIGVAIRGNRYEQDRQR